MEVLFSGIRGEALEPEDEEIYIRRLSSACQIYESCWYNRFSHRVEAKAGVWLADYRDGKFVNFIPEGSYQNDETTEKLLPYPRNYKRPLWP